jgi:hypothetical protein
MKLIPICRRIAACGAATILVAACPPVDPAPHVAERPGEARVHEGITYRAESLLLERQPATVLTTATVTNTSGEHREITLPGDCTVLIRAYTDEVRTSPVWEQERFIVCTLALQIVQLGPGDSVQYSMEATVPEILGDSLPAGLYYLSGLLRPDQDRVVVPAGALQLGN